MAITKPATGTAGFLGGSGTAITIAITPGAVNDLLLVSTMFDGNTGITFTISDTAGNSWVIANPVWTGAGTNRAQSWYAFANGTASTTITVTSSIAATFRIIFASAFRGTDLTSAVIGAHNETSGTGTPTSGSIVLPADDCAVFSFCADSVTAVGNIDGSAATKDGDDTQQDWSEYRILTGRNGASITAAFAGSSTFTIGTVVLRPPVASTQEQEGYRFRNDDGSETTATYKAAQDTPATIPVSTNFRLRVIVNTTGDAPATPYNLEYRKVGDAAWRNLDTVI